MSYPVDRNWVWQLRDLPEPNPAEFLPDAEAFAQRVIDSGRALESERDLIMSVIVDAAVADASPRLKEMTERMGLVYSFTRVQKLKEAYTSRPAAIWV